MERVLRHLGWLEFQRAELVEARRHLEEGTKRLELALQSNPEKREQILENVRRWRNMTEEQREKARERMREKHHK